MILIADNDETLRGRLIGLLIEHGLEAAGLALDAGTADAIRHRNPDLVIAGTVLKKNADEFVLLNGMITDGLFRERRLLLLVESYIPEKPGLRQKSTLELDCDAYCDKPVDTIQFVKTVRDLIDL